MATIAVFLMRPENGKKSSYRLTCCRLVNWNALTVVEILHGIFWCFEGNLHGYLV